MQSQSIVFFWPFESGFAIVRPFFFENINLRDFVWHQWDLYFWGAIKTWCKANVAGNFERVAQNNGQLRLLENGRLHEHGTAGGGGGCVQNEALRLQKDHVFLKGTPPKINIFPENGWFGRQIVSFLGSKKHLFRCYQMLLLGDCIPKANSQKPPRNFLRFPKIDALPVKSGKHFFLPPLFSKWNAFGHDLLVWCVAEENTWITPLKFRALFQWKVTISKEK